MALRLSTPLALGAMAPLAMFVTGCAAFAEQMVSQDASISATFPGERWTTRKGLIALKDAAGPASITASVVVTALEPKVQSIIVPTDDGRTVDVRVIEIPTP